MNYKRAKDIAFTERRFLESYTPEPNSGCWLWTGSVNTYGYGQLHSGPRLLTAHRYSYERQNGKPLKNFGCHKCDVPACVNPDHIFDGTPKDNHADMIAKGRGKPLPWQAV